MSTVTLSLAESYAAIHHGVVAFPLRYELVRLVGPDALSYLEGQVSQAVAQLGVGETTEALLLSPQGKIDAYLRCQRIGEQEVVLVVEDGYGSLVEERLRRFKIRVKAELELAAVAEAVRLVGPKAPADQSRSGQPWPGPFSVPFSWPGLSGLDLIGATPPEIAEIALGDPAALHTARIEAGLPAMASELAAGVIPQEAGVVEHTVSFMKGCYTGQELVARLDARGNRVPKSLRGVVLGGEVGLDQVAEGAPLLLDGREVGTLTSVGYSPRTASVVALAYIRREVTPPAHLVVRDLGGIEHGAAVEALPLWRE